MTNRIGNHIRANIVAYAALFFAMTGGTAYALDGSNTVFSDDIVNGEVKNGDIGAFEIKANNIAPDSLGGAKIADRSVKNADLGLGASSSNTIADGGIQAIDVKNNTLTGGQIDESTLAGLWKLGGNSGTTGTDFLGTTDNSPLNLRVNGARGLRLEPASDGTNQSPNVIGGIADNSVTPGAFGATIAGGGRSDPAGAATANRVTDQLGTIGGGADNQAGNAAGDPGDRPVATVSGGLSNAASGTASAVGGGSGNTASGFESIVGGGEGNAANASHATVGGGYGNTASGWSTVAGGLSNTASGQLSTVGGGGFNTASDQGTVGGGFSNDARAGTIGGGDSNRAISGGTVGGGESNIATGGLATVGGGNTNTATGVAATAPGGQSNDAAGDYSLAAGLGAKANDSGAFVWADSQFQDMASTAPDQFIARAQGHFFLQSDSTLADQGGFLNTSTGAFLSTGGTWTNSSDENLKAGFQRVDPKRILRRVDSLPVRSWHYKAEPSVPHIGPVAQDFYRAFGVGPDNRHISSVDADGVALAAIKGLSKKVERLQRTVASLRKRQAVR